MLVEHGDQLRANCIVIQCIEAEAADARAEGKIIAQGTDWRFLNELKRI